MGRRDRAKNFGCFSRSCGITSSFIFENQNHVLLGCFFGGIPQLFIHGRTIRRLIIESPEIEETDAIGMEGLGQLNTALEHFVLLLESEIVMALIVLRTELRLGCAWPVHLEERAGNIRHPQLVFFQDAARFIDFLGIQFEQVLVPHATQLDPTHSKFFRSYFARAAKVLTDLVIDNGDSERRIHTVTPSFCSRYFLLIAPDSLGVRVLSGTSSSSTMAQPLKFTLCNASNTAGRCNFPRPSSTKRYGRCVSAFSGKRSTSFICRKSSRSLYFSIAFAGSPPPWK